MDDRVVKPRSESNMVIKTTPKILIIKNKKSSISEHENASENRIRQDEIWCYTDGAKGDDMAAAAWVVVPENGLIEEEHGMRVPDL